MQNKKLVLVMGIFVVLMGAAAYIGGRMLNHKAGPIGLGRLLGGGDVMSISVNVVRAPELPSTQPEVLGLFVERQDQTIVIQSISLKAGKGGVVVASGGGGAAAVSPDMNSGPEVEVVVTNETTIYRETIEIGRLPSGETETIQQTVEESTLDDLNSQSMVTVWGRKSGDRIIAEVLFYSNPVLFKRP